MKPYDVILFDLDGTLTDPGEGITNSVAYALNKFGIEVNDKTRLYKFIGPPLKDAFGEFYGFSPEQSGKAVNYYREYYSEKGIFENYVYDGIEDLLKLLKKKGKCLLVATSKPEPFAVKILDRFGLSQYFHYIAGANMDETRTKKDQVISYALKHCSITDLSRVIMIGDRKHDILGAQKCGIDSLGVMFGYGSRCELEEAKATYIAETVPQILEFII